MIKIIERLEVICRIQNERLIFHQSLVLYFLLVKI